MSLNHVSWKGVEKSDLKGSLECHFNKAAKSSQGAFTLNESLPGYII